MSYNQLPRGTRITPYSLDTVPTISGSLDLPVFENKLDPKKINLYMYFPLKVF